ncbi:MAG: hypothetical protein AAFN77_21665 [Planctomycetota bacterium]
MKPELDAIEFYQDADWWRKVCPQLTIDLASPFQHRQMIRTNVPREPDWSECKRMIHNDGYFAYPSWYATDAINRLATCFDQLAGQGIHPAFAFVFDEAWDLLVQLRPMMEDLLGDFHSLPAVWSWHVTQETQTAFTPHRDQVRDVLLDDDDHLDYLTVWVPLTDLDHRSSCICVLPAPLDSEFEEGTADIRVENLQDVRCLQGPRGSVFCWSTQLVHWGTTQSEFGPPRKSVGFYLQRADVPCLDGPPLDFSQPTSLSQRLSIIGQQIIDYSRTATEEELNFAGRLVGLFNNEESVEGG